MPKAPPPDRDTRGRFMTGRRPHNAHVAEYSCLKDLVDRVALEPRTALLNGKRVTISYLERTFRGKVARAQAGNPREILALLKIMDEHPEVAELYPSYVQIIVGGAFANI